MLLHFLKVLLHQEHPQPELLTDTTLQELTEVTAHQPPSVSWWKASGKTDAYI